MKSFWLIVAGTVVGYTAGSLHIASSSPIIDRDSVLLNRADLDQLSIAIDGLGRSDSSRIYRFEASRKAGPSSDLILECEPGAETSCRLETRGKSRVSRSRI